MTVTATERVVLRKALDGTGFASERDLNQSQIKVAKVLVRKGLMKDAGQEPDRTRVYRITDDGRAAYEGPRK